MTSIVMLEGAQISATHWPTSLKILLKAPFWASKGHRHRSKNTLELHSSEQKKGINMA